MYSFPSSSSSSGYLFSVLLCSSFLPFPLRPLLPSASFLSVCSLYFLISFLLCLLFILLLLLLLQLVWCLSVPAPCLPPPPHTPRVSSITWALTPPSFPQSPTRACSMSPWLVACRGTHQRVLFVRPDTPWGAPGHATTIDERDYRTKRRELNWNWEPKVPLSVTGPWMETMQNVRTREPNLSHEPNVCEVKFPSMPRQGQPWKESLQNVRTTEPNLKWQLKVRELLSYKIWRLEVCLLFVSRPVCSDGILVSAFFFHTTHLRVHNRLCFGYLASWFCLVNL